VSRLSRSGTGIDALRFVVTGEGLRELLSGGVEALSFLRKDLEDLWRDFSFDLGVSGSLFRSFSAGFEGIVKCGEED